MMKKLLTKLFVARLTITDVSLSVADDAIVPEEAMMVDSNGKIKPPSDGSVAIFAKMSA